MHKKIILAALLFVSIGIFIPSVHPVSAQACPAGKECKWFNVADVTQFGVPYAPTGQNFYNDGATKNHLCQTQGYDFNPGDVKQAKWGNCNDEHYVTWNGSGWQVQACWAVSYVTDVFCARDVVSPPTVTLSADPTAVSFGGTTQISWSSTNATQCIAGGDWSGLKDTSGTEESGRFFLGDKFFVIQCSGPGGKASASLDVPIYYIPSAPTISWTITPGSVESGASYRVEAEGRDSDGDLMSVSIDKDGVPFAYVGGGDGSSNRSSNPTSDTGPKTVTYTAWAVDSTSRKSSVISQNVTINPPAVAGAPTISWTSQPSSAPSGESYTIEAEGRDNAGKLAKVSIDKDGTPFAYAGGGDGFVGRSGNPTSDVGPKTVTYTAWSEDSAGVKSSVISHQVQIGGAAWFCFIPALCGSSNPPADPFNPVIGPNPGPFVGPVPGPFVGPSGSPGNSGLGPAPAPAPAPKPVPGFTISVDPGTVRAKSLAGFSGITEQEARISVNPVAGFSSPVSVTVDQSSIPQGIQPEFSFDGGATYSATPTGVLTYDGQFYRSGGTIYLSVRIRFKGTLAKTTYPITFIGQGGGKSSSATMTVDSRPLYPGFQEL